MEIRYTELEAANHDLSDLVYGQSQEIVDLKARISELESRLKELAPGAVGSLDEESPPPHY
ncbi:MAG: SlyX family protein [Chromatiales bacterium]|nr:SlyX family protein [Chromatiales bacterium]